MEALRKKELGKDGHSLLHWSIVVLGTLFSGLVFSLVWFLLVFNGWVLWQTGVVWCQLLLGLPLMLLGFSMILINIYQIIAAIFDPYYSRSHCPFCRRREA